MVRTAATSRTTITEPRTDSGDRLPTGPIFPPDTGPPPPAGPVISGITETVVDISNVQVSWDVSPGATGQLEYGPDTGYGTVTTQEPGLLSFHIQNLPVTPGVTVHYRILATNPSVGDTAGADRTYLAAAGAPVISTPSVNPGGTTATVSFTVAPNSTGQVEHGLTTAYSAASAVAPSAASHAIAIGGLAPSTPYHYRVRCVSAESLETVTGDLTFTTTSGVQAAGIRGTIPTLTASGGTTPCGGSDRTNVTMSNLTYPSWTAQSGGFGTISWTPTAGHVHEVAGGTTRAQAHAVIAAATSGTNSNPCIVRFASGSSWTNWDTPYRLMPGRGFIILWGYGATINSTQVETTMFFTTGWGPIGGISPIHHIKILGFTLRGQYTLTTSGFYGYDFGIGIRHDAISEDIEVADNHIYEVHSDWVCIDGNADDWIVDGTHARRIFYHHNLMEKSGRQGIVLNQGDDIHVRWNILRDSIGTMIHWEDMRAPTQDMVRHNICDNIMDSWGWHTQGTPDPDSFGNWAIVLLASSAPPDSQYQVLGVMSDLRIERNTFLGGSKGFGASHPDLVYHAVIALQRPNDVQDPATKNIPKANTVIIDNDLTGIPAGQRRVGISVGWHQGLTVTGNNMPGQKILSANNTGTVTISGNTGATVVSTYP